MQRGKKMIWTEERIAELRRCYSVESNENLANRLETSPRTLVRKAKELGIYKSRPVTKTTGIGQQVRELYSTHSQTEIAEITHTSNCTIRRIVSELKITRTKEEDKEIRSRLRRKLIKSERARIAFGLDQRTNIKLVTNRSKIRLRTKLKSNGYIVKRGSKTIYYTPEMKRHLEREENGRKLGLEFAPWSVPAIITSQSILRV